MVGLFDAFDSSSGKKAARLGYQQQKQGLRDAGRLVTQGAEKATGTLEQGKTEGLGYLDTGADKAAGFYQQGIAPWQTLADKGNAGIDYYGQLVGLPGAGGDGMQQTLENIPGYQFARDQGIDALNRSANSRGMLASGNNTQDILRFSQGLADQNYFNYLNSVQPYFGLGQSAAGGVASGYGQLGGLYDQLGANKSNLASGTAGNVANVYSNAFNNRANLQTQKGQAGADMYANQYNAEQTANSNLWGAILGLGGAAAKAYAGGA